MTIFIISSYYKTGGPENLHQLCSCLNSKGADSYIYYMQQTELKDPLYDFPNIKITQTIQDTPENLLIIPEIYPIPDIRNFIHHMKIAVYWLSFTNACLFKSFSDNIDPTIIHLFQSYYTYAMLKPFLSPTTKWFFITDYIDPIFQRNPFIKKQNIIAYNHTKDKTTPILCQQLKIPCVPLSNMTRSETVDILNKCKVYIDLGYHPGKDRLPREAAMCGCVVITNKSGSAAYMEDVPIEEKITFDTDLLLLLPMVMSNYEKYYEKQEPYRKSIQEEKIKFENYMTDFIKAI